MWPRNPTNNFICAERTADDMLKEANELQGQDKEAIKRMKKTIAETEEVSGHRRKQHKK